MKSEIKMPSGKVLPTPDPYAVPYLRYQKFKHVTRRYENVTLSIDGVPDIKFKTAEIRCDAFKGSF